MIRRLIILLLIVGCVFAREYIAIIDFAGNPSGRMKAFSGIKDELKAYVNADDYCSIDLTNRDIIVQEIVGMAKNGDWRAIELLEKLGCLD